jgi:CrcB protein
MSDTSLLRRLEVVALVAIGGFAGSNLRFLVGGVLPGLEGTLFVNVVGSFALGVLLYEAIHAGVLAEQTRVVVGTGFLSSFTTYSTFAVETVTLGPVGGAANVTATYGIGVTAAFAGLVVGRRGDGGPR